MVYSTGGGEDMERKWIIIRDDDMYFCGIDEAEYRIVSYDLDKAKRFDTFNEADEEVGNNEVWQPHRLVDYLRSKSYNCGYGNLTPDDLIKYGLVTIKNL